MSSKPIVLLITGPAGAGKTTAARAWAESKIKQTAHLSLDQTRLNLRSGFVSPQNGWNKECQDQYDLAQSVIACSVGIYLQSGINCVIDDAVFPTWEAVDYEKWVSALNGAPLHMVVLLPDLPTVIDRNSRRSEENRLHSDEIKVIYDQMYAWSGVSNIPVVDSTDMSVAATVSEIDRTLSL